jgi:copper chaperone CopZ
MPTVLLCIEGMHGPGDEERVQDALRSEPGVYGVVANHEEGCAEVDIEDDQVTIRRLVELIETAGYHATLAG